MGARIRTIVRWVLVVWGAVSLVGIVVIAAVAAYQLGPGNREENDTASSHDVRFVLNWCQLGEKRIEKVIHSHQSAHSFTGDHVDAFAIKISHVDEAELTKPPGRFDTQWFRGDELPKVLDDAVDFVGGWRHQIAWFPTEQELRSAEFYIYSWSVHYRGLRPDGAQLVFVRPADKMVFYFGAKT